MNRIVNVVRMQLINRATYIWLPLIILAGSFVITLAIWGILVSSGVTVTFIGGGAQAPLWYFLVVGIYALTLSFPFSQAMSVTRREFFFGTLLTAALTSAILAAIFVIGGLIETATGGWGMDGYFFALPWVWEAGPLVPGLFYFVVAMLFFVIGFAIATVYKRWGPTAVTVMLIGLGVLLVGALFLIGRMNAWVQVFTWFAEQGAAGLTLWGALLAAVLALGSFGTLRRMVA